MKISLNMGQNGADSSRAAQNQILERDILAAKKGNWDARSNLARACMPLLTSLARKRTDDPAHINALIEAGKEGIFTAAKRYKPGSGTAGFQVFALDYIERRMDGGGGGGGGGFLSRLFGGK